MPEFYLRSARAYDSSLILKWRNDPVTRAASKNQDLISKENHDIWFRGVLENSSFVIFFICELKGVPVGCCSAYRDPEGLYRLSWNVSPDHRGEGVATWMVSEVVRMFPDCWAEIKESNIGSRKVAEKAGLILSEGHRDGEILCYSSTGR